MFLDCVGGMFMGIIGDPTYAETWLLGTRYHLFHSVGIILASGALGTRAAPVAGALMGAGILVFSGSLYLLGNIQPFFVLRWGSWPLLPVG